MQTFQENSHRFFFFVYLWKSSTLVGMLHHSSGIFQGDEYSQYGAVCLKFGELDTTCKNIRTNVQISLCDHLLGFHSFILNGKC